MAAHLRLTVTDYRDDAHFRWLLTDPGGKFLADDEVRLDTAAFEYRGYQDLPGHLQACCPPYAPEELLRGLGEWLGAKLFGGLLAALRRQRHYPVTVVRVAVPPEAQELLFRPLELAHLDAQPLAAQGIRFVYQLAGEPGGEEPRPLDGALRVLAVFSLPTDERPLNLRQERYLLQRKLREIAQTRGVAIDLRILQYGATRDTLRSALAEGRGWDIIHFSGHGLEGELVLEDEQGQADRIEAGDLLPLLQLAGERLKLLVLSACFSGAASLTLARAAVGLEAEPVREGGAAGKSTRLPSLAQGLAAELGCAALAMRYPVADRFAAGLGVALYDYLLEKGQPLPGALQLALEEALKGEAPPLSPITPVLFGPRAEGLLLTPPAESPSYALPRTGLHGFPPEPERFVGRVLPMLRASRALAPGSSYRGVLFYGMAGAGKTACALELAYRHERERFTGCVWYKAPDEGDDITTAPGGFLSAVESQLDMPDLALSVYLDEPERFRQRTLPRLRELLGRRAILVVVDNLEGLLTSSGGWRDPLWGEVVEVLLAHGGTSRLVLTSRRLPAALEDHPALLREPIHALSFPESVLLARDLPHLGPLLADAQGRDLLQQALAAVQGHPKLLDLADRLATDRGALGRRVAVSEGEADLRRIFFESGESAQAEDGFLQALRGWTLAIAGGLPPTARLLFRFLSCLEEADRETGVVEANWGDFLRRLGASSPAAQGALAEPGLGLVAALELLVASGLAEAGEPLSPPGREGRPLEVLRLHPAVAQAGREEAAPACQEAADRELGDFWLAVCERAQDGEAEGLGPLLVKGARGGVPYLRRARRWAEARWLLELLIRRDRGPAALAMALPLLRQVARETGGDAEGLKSAVTLARALRWAGRPEEAEPLLRQALVEAVDRGDYGVASTTAGDLLDLLREGGRLEEALSLAGDMTGFTRRAGLGPWSELADEGMRLQVLTRMGRDREVLAVVEELRPRLAALAEVGTAEEIVRPWNVREGILDSGRQAAQQLAEWQAALGLNAEILASKRQRGAGELELARARFNDYGPLLRLRRRPEARQLLEACREAFARHGDAAGLGKVLGALANLEHTEGHPGPALRFACAALGQAYQAGRPEDCAISHHNLASYLERAHGAPEAALTHRLAAAAIRLQTGSGLLGTTLSNLAASALPGAPPGFDQVAERVEGVEGVRFRQLFARLPARAADGEAAIAEVWRMAQEERARREEERAGRERLLAGLPAPVRAAVEAKDRAALTAVLGRLPPDQAEAITAQLEAAGIITVRRGPDMDPVLRELDPLLRDIAAVAKGEDGPRAGAEARLAKLEESGWHLTAAVQRIWAGERDGEALTAGLDASDSTLVRRALELIEAPPTDERPAPTRDEVLATVPSAVRAAIEAGDVTALGLALKELPGEEAEAIVGRLEAAGMVGMRAAGADMAQILSEFEPLLRAVAAAARGDEGQREQVRAVLQGLEEKGWHLTGAVQRIWAGERDVVALTEDLDDSDSALVRRILELL